MKKLLALLLALILVFSMVSCAEEYDSGDDDEEEESESLTEDAKTEDNKTGQSAMWDETAEDPKNDEVKSEEAETEEKFPQEAVLSASMKKLVGKWKIYVDYGSYFEAQFEGNALSGYFDYDGMIVPFVTVNLKENESCTTTFKVNDFLDGMDGVIDVIIDGIDRYLQEHNLSFEALYGVSKEEYAELLRKTLDSTLANSLPDQDMTNAGIWSATESELILPSDKGDDIVFEYEKSGKVYVLTSDTFQGVPLLMTK